MTGRATRLGLAAVPALAAWAALAAPEGAGRDWQGRYVYEHDPGLSEGGSATLVSYDLALGPQGARGGCLLTIRGFQTDERILCQTRTEGSTLTVTFHRYENGSLVNRYGTAVYKPGEALLTLSRSGSGSGTGPITRWRSLRPDGESVAESGAYFMELR
ncbi:hypothetical protein HNR00_000404 [Methylorubrum rhodinum]|jgi:hypothetical protein|uniref:Uncharacterized protein n=1 Tax=Methylorubrum rhodinum TaxID=29428 RepID=A0A840ZEV7_9HYPH|nr:DUF5991 domain-containing protein [Methylorubrum rhodinum]MBB5755715.1 hypothetical protein [Methylorubrum rhodinum]